MISTPRATARCPVLHLPRLMPSRPMITLLMSVWRKRVASGSSPVPLASRGNMASLSLRTQTARRGMALIVQRIRNGRFSERFRDMFLGYLLVAVPKPDGSPHPVTIGETFYKMAAFMALESNGIP